MSSLDTSRPNPIRPIKAAAAAVATVDAGGPFQGHSEVALSRPLFALDKDRALHAAPFVATVHAYTLEHVVLDADSLLLFQDGKLIPESDYFAPPEAPRAGVTDAVPAPEPDVDYILGYNLVHWGYQHWVTQALPAIDWAMQRPRTREVCLVLPVLADWQEEFLRILGYADVPRFTPPPGSRVRFRRLEFSEYLIGVHSFAVSRSLRQTIGRILDNIPPGRGRPDASAEQIPFDATAPGRPDVPFAQGLADAPAASTSAMLYVPGALTYYGTLQNEAEAIALLRARGVHIVAADLPAAERINLFRQADIVIGPLGQGLTDVAFCHPGALMWEWMPLHHQNVAFNRLAQAAGVDYLGDVFPSVQSADGSWTWQVSVELISARLDALAERLARKAEGGASSVPPVSPAHGSDTSPDGNGSAQSDVAASALAGADVTGAPGAECSPAATTEAAMPLVDPAPTYAEPGSNATAEPYAEPGSAVDEPAPEMFPPLAGSNQPETADATPAKTLAMVGGPKEQMPEEQMPAEPAAAQSPPTSALPWPERRAQSSPSRKRSLLSRVFGRA